MFVDEVEQAWSWVDSIIGAWAAKNEPPEPYQAGTWGPVESIGLLAKTGRAWYQQQAVKKAKENNMALVSNNFHLQSS